MPVERKETKKERRDRILAELRRLQTNTDREAAHSLADAYLLELIADDEIREAYDAIEKMYA